MTFNDHFGSSGLGNAPKKEILTSKMKDLASLSLGR